MDRSLICRLLGLICLLLAAAMAVSLPWTLPWFGEVDHFDLRAFLGLGASIAISLLVGGVFLWVGRGSRGRRLYRREAIAVVGLSWLLATVLGALPFWLSKTCHGRDEAGKPALMTVSDGLFESASGFSGTGATTLTDLEDPELVPRAVLFWRSETHFLGGLGIMVLFVAILGLGSAGKALMLTEMPGPSQETSHTTTQRTAWAFAFIFIGLTVVLSVLLLVQGMSLFDSLCHAFGAIATGGFSTYNNSVEHFHDMSIEMTLTAFMIIACTNFTLLYFVVVLQPGKLIADAEFRVYLAILFTVAALVMIAGLHAGDFANFTDAFRYGLFQVVSIMTNTGFGTHNFDQWNSFGRAILVLLMFVGGCAGSTSCSIKVIRHLLFFKIFRLEMERVYRPNVVRHVRVGGKSVEAPDLRKDVLAYFCAVLLLFLVAWLALVTIEPDETWTAMGHSSREKLVDCASAVAATLNGVGPGLGVVGESETYAHFHAWSKFILTWMMLLGRLEIFALVVLFDPRFWRSQ